MRILNDMAAMLIFVAFALPAAAQGVGVDQHGRFIPAGLDRVTVRLSGFSPEAETATVTMIGHHSDGVPEDGPFCLDIRPLSVMVELNDGAGEAVWSFTNRFDGRYRLRCRIRADDGAGGVADGRIHTFGGEPRLWLDPAMVEPETTTQIDVSTWLASGYTNGTARDFSDPGWPDNPPQIAAGCDGVTLTQLGDFERMQTETGGVVAAPFEAVASEPVECPITASAQDFEADTTLSVASAVPALPVAGLLFLAVVLVWKLRRAA